MFGDLLVFFRIQVAESQVFQFPLDLPNAKPICQRRKNIERFFGNSLALVLGHDRDRHADGVVRRERRIRRGLEIPVDADEGHVRGLEMARVGGPPSATTSSIAVRVVVAVVVVVLMVVVRSTEGVGGQLYPEVNMWQQAESWLKNWAIDNLTIEANIKNALSDICEFIKNIPDKLKRLDAIIIRGI